MEIYISRETRTPSRLQKYETWISYLFVPLLLHVPLLLLVPLVPLLVPLVLHLSLFYVLVVLLVPYI